MRSLLDPSTRPASSAPRTHRLGPWTSLVMVGAIASSGCASCREDAGPVAPTPPPPTLADFPSEVTDDGWTHWELPSAWPEAPLASLDAPVPEGPEELVTSLAVAGRQGVPDGRGAALHEVELPIRSFDGEDTTIRGPRMVVPGAVRGARFAIDRGVLVPVAAMGPELDLVERFTAALEAAERFEPTDELCPLGDAWPEVLMRGRRDLVDRYAALPMTAFAARQMVGERHRELARRALASFHRADDEAARRDLADRRRLDESTLLLVLGHGATSYPDETIAQLERELELRSAASPAPSTIDGEIEALLDVTVPGALTLEAFASDPRVRALVARGEPAVPALLDALEERGRTTRVVHVDPFRHEARLLDRTDAVYAALASILDVDFHPPGAFADFLTHQEPATVAELHVAARTYWEQMRELSPTERRWRVLSDDERSPAEWAEAAMWMVEPSGRPRAFSQFRPFPIVGEPPMQGEPLRTRTEPSLTELIVRRLTTTTDDTIWRCVLAVAAARWDPHALTPHLSSLDRDCAMSLLPALGPEGHPRLAEALRSRGSMVMFTAGLALDVWAPYLLEAASDASVASALEAVLNDRADESLIDSRVPVAVDLARRGFLPARTALIALLHDPSVYGVLWPGADGQIVGPVSVSLGEPITTNRDVTRGEVTALFVRELVGLPYAFGADEATRAAQLEAIVASLAPPAGAP